MSWESDEYFQTTPKQRYDAAIAKLNVKAAERQRQCVTYANRLRDRGFDVTPEWVNDRFTWVDTWANRLIAIGHLVNRTGMRRMTRAQYAEWSKTMSIPKAVMLDTIGTCAANIPRATPYIGGYVTGSGVVPWSAADWSLFPNVRHVRIDQHASQSIAVSGWDALDMETNALTAAEVAYKLKARVDNGIEWTTVYATRSNLALCTAALKDLGEHYFIGHVNYWLADWNLNEEEASALIGTFVSDASVVAVQWASPSSNPNTVVPGGSHTLSQANVDISVVNANWIPSGPFPVSAPKPTAKPTEHGELVVDDAAGNLTAHDVSSTDGTHWQ